MDQNTLPVDRYAEIKEKLGTGKPAILSFGMTHCYSCLAISKLFYEIKQQHPDLQIYSIDSQRDRLISRDIYGLKEMPTQIFLNGEGEEVFRHTGVYKKQVLEVMMRKYGFGI